MRESLRDTPLREEPFSVTPGSYGVSMSTTATPPSGSAAHWLENVEPGIELAARLAVVDVDRLSGYDRIAVLQAHQRLASHYAAQVYRDMASVSASFVVEDGVDLQSADEFAAAEIRAALRLTRRSADAELSFALDLQRRLPQVCHSLEDGLIDVRRAKVFDRCTIDLPIATARTIVDLVLADAPNLTTGQLAARLDRLRMEVEPEAAEDRYEHAVNDRRVVMEPTPAGTANIYAYDLPPDRASALMKRINRTARSLRRAGDQRSMDQLRTDVFLDFGTAGSAESPPEGSVDLLVDLETLAGLNDDPGELAGYGPVIADVARDAAERQDRGEWTYTVTDPETGRPLVTGTTRRRPTAAQRREVAARNRTCVFPGCRMPARDCDLDHRIPRAQGGKTRASDLGPCCRHDHRIRHAAGWSYEILPNGDITWRSALGHVYRTGSSTGLPP